MSMVGNHTVLLLLFVVMLLRMMDVVSVMMFVAMQKSNRLYSNSSVQSCLFVYLSVPVFKLCLSLNLDTTYERFNSIIEHCVKM